ncbi:hypothetical protein MASR1M48_17470 [Lactococcus petauri]
MTTLIKLPALGIEVPVRPMKVKEFDLLTNQVKMASGDALEELLIACIEGDQKPDVTKMLSADRNALLIGIRRATFGNMYEFSVKSPFDSEGKTQTFEVDLSLLELKEGNRELVKKRLENPDATFPYEMADGTKILWRFTDGTDVKKALKAMKSDTKATQDLLLRIVKVEGLEDKGIPLKRWLGDLNYADMQDFNDYYEENSPGVDETIELVCQRTGEPFTVKLEISTENFFKRSSRKKTS